MTTTKSTTLSDSLAQSPAARSVLKRRLKGPPGRPLLLLCPIEQHAHTVAKAYAQALLCSRPTESPTASMPAGCGACGDCRQLLRAAHPRYFWPPVSSRGLAIKEVRALQQALPYRQSAPVFVGLEGGGHMPRAAQNALLKLLEEPPPACHVVVMAARLRGLLPTLRSRLEVVRFGTGAPEDGEQAMQLAGVPTELAPLAASLFGLDGEAAAAWTSGSALGAYEALREALKAGDDQATLGKLVQLWQGDASASAFGLSLLEAALADALSLQQGHAPTRLRLPSFETLLLGLSPAQLAASADAVLALRASAHPAQNLPLALEGIVHLLVQ